MALLAAAGRGPNDSLIDVGGGASTLVDALLAAGWSDLTVLDISAAGLAQAQARLGPPAAKVGWVRADIRCWQPSRQYRVWHDRAVLHFFVDAGDRRSYAATLHAATEAGSVAIFGVFAPDGPRQCSGLPVSRFSTADLAAFLGPPWVLLADRTELHRTPRGAGQSFTWAAFQRLERPRNHDGPPVDSAGRRH